MMNMCERETINNFTRKEKEMKKRRERIAEYISGVLCLVVCIASIIFTIVYIANDKDSTSSGYWTKNPDFISFELTPDEEPSIWVEE